MQVNKNDHAELFTILRHAGYRKHKASVSFSVAAELRTPGWSGGSITSNFRLSAAGHTQGVAVRTRQQFGDETLPWTQLVATGNGSAVVKGGTFQGKPAHWSITIHPDDAALFGITDAEASR